jgi:Winged helix DNA-binding domain
VTDVLNQRGLNRATLARQNLLERAPARAIDAIEHLGGMQSQAPLAPYVGLWTRLQDFAPDELSALTRNVRWYCCT